MEKAADCYEMADKCLQMAKEVRNARDRTILLEVAELWRKLGDDLKKEETATRRPSSRTG